MTNWIDHKKKAVRDFRDRRPVGVVPMRGVFDTKKKKGSATKRVTQVG